MHQGIDLGRWLDEDLGGGCCGLRFGAIALLLLTFPQCFTVFTHYPTLWLCPMEGELDVIVLLVCVQGSNEQLFFALLVCFAAMGLYAGFLPYKTFADNAMALLGEVLITLCTHKSGWAMRACFCSGTRGACTSA